MLLKGTSRRQSSSGMLSIVLFMVVMAVRRVSAFVVTTTSSQPSLLPHSTVVEGRTSSPCRTSSSSLEMMMMGPTTESWMMASNNLWISTIDADIANISNDQFGLVFAGGIAVMIGSVISALAVGFMLEKGDLYASVAAESYIQSADDEAFWKNLSEEEQVKARELLDKFKASKEGGSSSSSSSPPLPTAVASKPAVSATPVQASAPTDMFNDY